MLQAGVLSVRDTAQDMAGGEHRDIWFCLASNWQFNLSEEHYQQKGYCFATVIANQQT